jgi:hypothetical protein
MLGLCVEVMIVIIYTMLIMNNIMCYLNSCAFGVNFILHSNFIVWIQFIELKHLNHVFIKS